jgi:hypothetical protein
MSSLPSFEGRFIGTIRPTTNQTVASVIISAAILIAAQSHALLSRIGVTPRVIQNSGGQLNLRLDAVLRANVTGQIALVTFWAIVGLIAYLICWGVYNVFIEARNEVTLNTTYINRGHWRGPWQTLALKGVSGVGLVVVALTLWPGFSAWVALSSRAVAQPNVSSILLACAAVLCFAVQLYGMVAFVQLTFTPWYRAEAFTED